MRLPSHQRLTIACVIVASLFLAAEFLAGTRFFSSAAGLKAWLAGHELYFEPQYTTATGPENDRIGRVNVQNLTGGRIKIVSIDAGCDCIQSDLPVEVAAYDGASIILKLTSRSPNEFVAKYVYYRLEETAPSLGVGYAQFRGI